MSAEENGSRGFEKSPVTVYWENIYAGYRYFDTFQKNVLFPFGYGLSYTTFELTETGTQKNKDGIKVVVRVKNTGTVPGKEVAQVYWSKMDQEGSEHPDGRLWEVSKKPPCWLLVKRKYLALQFHGKNWQYMKKSEPHGCWKKGSMHCVWETLPKIRSVENLCKQNRIMFWSNVRIA